MSLKYYEPKYFLPQELVPPKIYSALGDKSLLVMDYRILKTIDVIREFFGKPVHINTWLWNKRGRKFSGFRPRWCNVGARYSQHRFGRATDCLIEDTPATVARGAIMEAQLHFPYITVLEDRVNWLHIDCRAVSDHGIQLVYP